ncbi:MAG: hypothetical protein AAF360_10515 [Pseudomonadota bacterium]
MQLDRKPKPTIHLEDPAGATQTPGPTLALGRAHEATGPAALAFAALIAAALSGPILWVRPAWARSALNPEGLAAFFDPARLVTAHADRPLDILWAAEEALRSGAAPFVVAEAAEPPALTPLRRLQLAAEAGGDAAKAIGAGGRPPLCLLLPPAPGRSGAVETRWRCDPSPSSGPGAATGEDRPYPPQHGDAPGGFHTTPRWRFERTYAKGGAPMIWEAGGRALSVLAA